MLGDLLTIPLYICQFDSRIVAECVRDLDWIFFWNVEEVIECRCRRRRRVRNPGYRMSHRSTVVTGKAPQGNEVNGFVNTVEA